MINSNDLKIIFKHIYNFYNNSLKKNIEAEGKFLEIR